jgi:hypothetical protein
MTYFFKLLTPLRRYYCFGLNLVEISQFSVTITINITTYQLKICDCQHSYT